MDISKAATKYYQRVMKQMESLYPANCIDSEKAAERCRLEQVLSLSKRFCLCRPEYLLLTLYIDCLVCRWDEMREERILNRRHSFVIVDRSSLCMYDLSGFQGMLALMFDYQSAPDNRIIVIAIDNCLSIHQNLYGILHEVGHYVGCRQRIGYQPNRIHFFIDLALQAFLRDVFLNACSSLLNESEVNNAVLSNPVYHPEKRQIMREMIVCLSDNTLYSWLYQTLNNNVKSFLEEHIQEDIYRFAYKKVVANAISLSFQRVFDPSILRKEFQRQIYDSARKHQLHDDSYKQLMGSIERVILEQIPEPGEAFAPKDFGVNAGNLLMEVAADVFMARFMDMGPMYLEHMLRSFTNQYSEWEKHIEEELLDDTGERARLVCLQAACMDFSIQKKNKMGDIWKRIFHGIKKRLNGPPSYSLQYNKLLCISKKLNSTLDQTLQVSYENERRIYDTKALDVSDEQINHANQLRILNPCVTLGEYVRIIMNDVRYDKFLQDDRNNEIVKSLRALGSKPRFLIYLDVIFLNEKRVMRNFF